MFCETDYWRNISQNVPIADETFICKEQIRKRDNTIVVKCYCIQKVNMASCFLPMHRTIIKPRIFICRISYQELANMALDSMFLYDGIFPGTDCSEGEPCCSNHSGASSVGVTQLDHGNNSHV